MTILESLLSVVNYPIPESAIENIADSRGLDITDNVTTEIRASESFILATADVLVWTSYAPNVVQGGVQFNLLVTDREKLREKANLIYKEYDDPKYQPMIRQTFSYTGTDV